MNIIADTCFWISLCDDSQPNHCEVVQIFDKIIRDGRHRIVVPHPVLYETLCTEMVKKTRVVLSLIERYFPLAERISDSDYVEEAYTAIENQAAMKDTTASMVDFVIMLMAERRDNNIGAILTANSRDFGGFCRKHCIPMIDRMAVLLAV